MPGRGFISRSAPLIAKKPPGIIYHVEKIPPDPLIGPGVLIYSGYGFIFISCSCTGMSPPRISTLIE